jgi:hypothetical protein
LILAKEVLVSTILQKGTGRRPRLWFSISLAAITHSVHVTCSSEGQIRAKIYHVDGRFYSLVSPKLLRPVSATIKCAFRWSDEDAAMAVAGTIVSKTSDTDIYTKSTLTIPEEQWEPDGKVSAELLAAAEISRKNRTRSVKDRKSTISDTKRLRTLEEDLASLSDRGLALYDLLKLIENGKDYHLSPSGIPALIVHQ